jgi:hypothetical protein
MRVRLSIPSLARVGVKVVGDLRSGDILLTCQTCGQTWLPMLRRGGRLPRGWWHCPTNGCNKPPRDQ